MVLWNIEPEPELFEVFSKRTWSPRICSSRSTQPSAPGHAGSLYTSIRHIRICFNIPKPDNIPLTIPRPIPFIFCPRACLLPRPQSWLRPGYAQVCSPSFSLPASSSFWHLHLPASGIDSPPSSTTSDPPRLQDSPDRLQTPVWRPNSTVRRHSLLRCLRRRRRVCLRMRGSFVTGRGACWIRYVLFGVHFPLLVRIEGL